MEYFQQYESIPKVRAGVGGASRRVRGGSTCGPNGCWPQQYMQYAKMLKAAHQPKKRVQQYVNRLKVEYARWEARPKGLNVAKQEK